MFGIGPLEIVVVVLFALIFVGPKRLPEVARQFGRFFVKVRRMTSDVRNTIDDAIREAEHDLLLEERKQLQELLAQQQTRAQEAAKALMEEAGSEANVEEPEKKIGPLDQPSETQWEATPTDSPSKSTT